MASVVTSNGNEVIFTWIIENFSYWPFGAKKELSSPSFYVGESGENEWQLYMYPRGVSERGNLGLFLKRKFGREEFVSVSFELQILNKEGSPIISRTINDHLFVKEIDFGFKQFTKEVNIYECKGKEVLQNNNMTVRARLFNYKGELSNSIYCSARTRIGKRKISSTWTIENFNTFELGEEKTYVLPTSSKNIPQIVVILIIDGGSLCKQYLSFKIIVKNSQEHTLVTCSFCFLNANNEKSVSKTIETWSNESKPVGIPCLFSKELLSTGGYLNDTVRIYMEFVLSKGIVYEDIESYISGPQVFVKNELSKKKSKDNISNDLSHDLQFLHMNNQFSDVTLETEYRNFTAHQAILSARSPVFKAMFSTNMQESSSASVQITDIDGKTLQHMLLFMYTDKVSKLNLDSAKKLYFAADKYQIQLLQKECTNFLVKQLSNSNACDMLVLADLHHDQAFKSSVIEFVKSNHTDILKLSAWNSLMKNNVSLASEVMYGIIKKS